AAGSTTLENDDDIPTIISVALTAHNSQPVSKNKVTQR
ncbi:SEC8 exocyst complex component specific domain protein, partial [Trifolium medium]|nr:SEC8 exocyst complex component specific domain protein [Trifolium medium]